MYIVRQRHWIGEGAALDCETVRAVGAGAHAGKLAKADLGQVEVPRQFDILQTHSDHVCRALGGSAYGEVATAKLTEMQPEERRWQTWTKRVFESA